MIIINNNDNIRDMFAVPAAQRLQLWQERVRELEAQRTEMLRLHAEQLSALNLEREERLMESGKQLAQAEAKIARAEEGRLGPETEAQRLRQHVVQLQMEKREGSSL